MDCTALSQPFSSLTLEQREQLRDECALLSLSQAFAHLPDPRWRHGLRYDLPFLLTCLVAALLCPCNHREAGAQWCHGQRAIWSVCLAKDAFSAQPERSIVGCFLNSRSTHCKPCSPVGFWPRCPHTRSLPSCWMAQWFAEPKLLSKRLPTCFPFGRMTRKKRCCKSVCKTKPMRSPLRKRCPPSLSRMPRIYPADAFPTQVKWMQVLHECPAFTVLTVKDNQPTLLQDVQTYFPDPPARCTQAYTWDRHRGRVEHRSIRVTCEMNAYLHSTWPHIAHVAQLTHMVTSKKGTTTETVYLITNLSPAQASPERRLEVMRGHWSIENGSPARPRRLLWRRPFSSSLR